MCNLMIVRISACHPKLARVAVHLPPTRFGGQVALQRHWLGLPSVAPPKGSEGWAHQDLNLEPADYEPAALTVELWARKQLAVVSPQSKSSVVLRARVDRRLSTDYEVLPSKNARSFRLREGCRSLRSALASIWRMRSRVTAK